MITNTIRRETYEYTEMYPGIARFKGATVRLVVQPGYQGETVLTPAQNLELAKDFE